MSIITEVTDIFRQVFDDENIDIRPEMTADDIDGWDSLSHINLIIAIESSFNIRFSQKELLGFKNVGDLLNCIATKSA